MSVRLANFVAKYAPFPIAAEFGGGVPLVKRFRDRSPPTFISIENNFLSRNLVLTKLVISICVEL